MAKKLYRHYKKGPKQTEEQKHSTYEKQAESARKLRTVTSVPVSEKSVLNTSWGGLEGVAHTPTKEESERYNAQHEARVEERRKSEEAYRKDQEEHKQRYIAQEEEKKRKAEEEVRRKQEEARRAEIARRRAIQQRRLALQKKVTPIQNDVVQETLSPKEKQEIDELVKNNNYTFNWYTPSVGASRHFEYINPSLSNYIDEYIHQGLMRGYKGVNSNSIASNGNIYGPLGEEIGRYDPNEKLSKAGLKYFQEQIEKKFNNGEYKPTSYRSAIFTRDEYAYKYAYKPYVNWINIDPIDLKGKSISFDVPDFKITYKDDGKESKKDSQGDTYVQDKSTSSVFENISGIKKTTSRTGLFLPTGVKIRSFDDIIKEKLPRIFNGEYKHHDKKFDYGFYNTNSPKINELINRTERLKNAYNTGSTSTARTLNTLMKMQLMNKKNNSFFNSSKDFDKILDSTSDDELRKFIPKNNYYDPSKWNMKDVRYFMKNFADNNSNYNVPVAQKGVETKNMPSDQINNFFDNPFIVGTDNNGNPLYNFNGETVPATWSESDKKWLPTFEVPTVTKYGNQSLLKRLSNGYESLNGKYGTAYDLINLGLYGLGSIPTPASPWLYGAALAMSALQGAGAAVHAYDKGSVDLEDGLNMAGAVLGASGKITRMVTPMLADKIGKNMKYMKIADPYFDKIGNKAKFLVKPQPNRINLTRTNPSWISLIKGDSRYLLPSLPTYTFEGANMLNNGLQVATDEYQEGGVKGQDAINASKLYKYKDGAWDNRRESDNVLDIRNLPKVNPIFTGITMIPSMIYSGVTGDKYNIPDILKNQYMKNIDEINRRQGLLPNAKNLRRIPYFQTAGNVGNDTYDNKVYPGVELNYTRRFVKGGEETESVVIDKTNNTKTTTKTVPGKWILGNELETFNNIDNSNLFNKGYNTIQRVLRHPERQLTKKSWGNTYFQPTSFGSQLGRVQNPETGIWQQQRIDPSKRIQIPIPESVTNYRSNVTPTNPTEYDKYKVKSGQQMQMNLNTPQIYVPSFKGRAPIHSQTGSWLDSFIENSEENPYINTNNFSNLV